jgi:hypothetical protein
MMADCGIPSASAMTVVETPCFGLRPVAFGFGSFVLSESDKTAGTFFTSATVCFAALNVRPRSASGGGQTAKEVGAGWCYAMTY